MCQGPGAMHAMRRCTRAAYGHVHVHGRSQPCCPCRLARRRRYPVGVMTAPGACLGRAGTSTATHLVPPVMEQEEPAAALAVISRVSSHPGTKTHQQGGDDAIPLGAPDDGKQNSTARQAAHLAQHGQGEHAGAQVGWEEDGDGDGDGVVVAGVPVMADGVYAPGVQQALAQGLAAWRSRFSSSAVSRVSSA